jgi:hypothetical protein
MILLMASVVLQVIVNSPYSLHTTLIFPISKVFQMMMGLRLWRINNECVSIINANVNVNMPQNSGGGNMDRVSLSKDLSCGHDKIW